MYTSAPKLRKPFQIIADSGEYVVSKVNKSVDSSYDYGKKTMDGVMKSKYVTMATKSLTAFEKDVVTKTKPYTAKAKPYIQPVVPYIEKAKPYAPPLAAAVVVLASIPVFFTLFLLAAVTSPVWGFFALITSFIWVPLAIVASLVLGTVFFFGATIAAVRYFSKPKGLAILRKQWKTISSTTYGKKIFFQ